MSEEWDSFIMRAEAENREAQRRAQFEPRPDPLQEIARLRALLTKAVNALDPFAHQADIIDFADKDAEPDEWFRFRGSITAVTLGDCRRAKEALEELRKAIQ